MLPDRHAPTQETEPANARTGPETFPSSPKQPVVAAGGTYQCLGCGERTNAAAMQIVEKGRRVGLCMECVSLG